MADSLLSALNVTPNDKIIAVRENKLADANFVLTSLMAKCFAHKENICLVILHNTIGHYQNVGKRLGYDLLNQIKDGCAKTLEPLKDILEDISSNNGAGKYLSPDKESIVKNLFMEIKMAVDELSQNGAHTTLILDDISHLVDLGVDFRTITKFISHCNSLTFENNVSVVINSHVSTQLDINIANTIRYPSDLSIIVSSLKTGRSLSVTGSLIIDRPTNDDVPSSSIYHYKTTDKEIKTFAPGRAIF